MFTARGNNDVIPVTVSDLTISAIKQALKFLSWQNKSIKLIGGKKAPGVQGSESNRYLKAPTVAVCSNERHAQNLHATNGPQSTPWPDLIFDMHTFECPIETTASNTDVSIADARLDDCAVGAVLTIYTVQRPDESKIQAGCHGKASIFRKSKCRQHPMGESERGLSNMLSTLRVFSNISNAKHMDEAQRDVILRTIFLLTRFPPVVRAAHILVRGETTRPCECAALSQALSQVLEEVIRADKKRYFEGSCLLFGLILDQDQKHENISNVLARNAIS